MFEFDTDLVTVGQLFAHGTEISYKVPMLQRNYVWTEENVTNLLNDINENFKTDLDSPYFLGGMVFSKDDEGDNLLVIDGQQRLTTLVLLSVSARDYFNSKGDEASRNLNSEKIFVTGQDPITGDPVKKCVLNLQTRDEEIFKRIIDENKTISYNGFPESALIEAKETCDTYLEKVDNVKLLMRYVYNNVKIVKTTAENQSTAFRIFETLNDRGIKLAPEDLLKNLLLSKIADDEYDLFAAKWTNFTNNLMENGKYKVNPTTFLKHYIMAEEMYISKIGVFDYFKKEEKQGNLDRTKVLDLLKDLEYSSEKYIEYFDGRGNDSIVAMKKLNFRQGLVVLLASKNFSDKQFKKVCELLERIAFSYVITSSPTNTLEQKVVNIAKLAREATYDPSKIDLVYDSLKQISEEKREDVKNALMEIKLKRSTKSKIEYMLKKLSHSLDGGEYSKYSIEHILPRTRNSGWDHITGEYDDLKSRLGNLTLISSSDNSSLQNKSFSEKQQVYKSQPCRLTSSLTDKLSTGTRSTAFDKAINVFNYEPPTKWDEEEINRRTKRLVMLADYVFNNS